jgi:hypothetical protein
MTEAKSGVRANGQAMEVLETAFHKYRFRLEQTARWE